MDRRGQATLSVHLDTHVLLWLSRRRLAALGDSAKRLARTQAWRVSPAVILELEILHEIGRIRVTAEQVLVAASEVGDLSVSQAPFTEVTNSSLALSWTRNPLDRLIVAQAIADGDRLLTADGQILKNFRDAVWD